MHVQTKGFSPNACKNLIFAFSHLEMTWGGTGSFAGVWLRRQGRRLRMEWLGGILQMTASTCWWSRRRFRTGGARASSPERLRALLAIHAVTDKSVLGSWVACACCSCGLQPPTTDVYDSPNARAWPRTRPRRADAAAGGTACTRVDGQARGHAPRRSTS